MRPAFAYLYCLLVAGPFRCLRLHSTVLAARNHILLAILLSFGYFSPSFASTGNAGGPCTGSRTHCVCGMGLLGGGGSQFASTALFSAMDVVGGHESGRVVAASVLFSSPALCSSFVSCTFAAERNIKKRSTNDVFLFFVCLSPFAS